MEKRKNYFGKRFHCVQIIFRRTNLDTAWELGKDMINWNHEEFRKILSNFFIHCRYTIDLIVCVALGADMFDCVYPTRTAVSLLNLHFTLTKF